MAIDPRAKGSRAESDVRDKLREHTGLNWERTPSSGALDAKHQLKGDLYVVGEKNLYAVEVKHYKDDHLTSKILTDKTPQVQEWWLQALRQGSQMSKIPILIFKFDRSKLFVAFQEMPSADYRYLYYSEGYYIAVLQDWLINEQPKFIA